MNRRSFIASLLTVGAAPQILVSPEFKWKRENNLYVIVGVDTGGLFIQEEYWNGINYGIPGCEQTVPQVWEELLNKITWKPNMGNTLRSIPDRTDVLRV